MRNPAQILTIIGPPGVGKTTLGERLSDILDGAYFDPDEIWEELKNDPDKYVKTVLKNLPQEIVDAIGSAENFARLGKEGLFRPIIENASLDLFTRRAFRFAKKSKRPAILTAGGPDMHTRSEIGKKFRRLNPQIKLSLLEITGGFKDLVDVAEERQTMPTEGISTASPEKVQAYLNSFEPFNPTLETNWDSYMKITRERVAQLSSLELKAMVS